MSIRPIDIGIVQQLSDLSQTRQHEIERPMVEQQGIYTQIQKNVNHKTKEISKKDNADHNQNKYDAKDQSDNQYEGNQKHARTGHSVNQDGTVTIKGQPTTDFDIKI